MNLLKTVRTDYQVILFLCLVAVYHVILQDRGALSWPDEHLYNDALRSIACLIDFDISGFCRELTGFGARPAEATLRLVPAAIQTILEKSMGISPYNPESLRIPATFNLISSFLLSFVFYRLSQIFFDNDRLTALLSTVVFALLVSNNVFVRHIIPYDTALMFCLLSLYYALKSEDTGEGWGLLKFRTLIMAGMICGAGLLLYPASFLVSRTAALYGAIFCLACILLSLWLVARHGHRTEVKHWILTGLISGFGLALYPAYYAFPGGVLLVILLTRVKAPYVGLSWNRLYAAIIFGLSVLSVMFFYEMVSRVGNESYLACAYRLSKTITQGEFAEGYSFVPKYFVEVEGAIGIVLLVGAVVWLAAFLMRIRKPETISKAQCLLAVCFAVWCLIYLVYATQSTVLHKMAFTGRYARMYFPFIVWMGVAVPMLVSGIMLKRLLLSGILLVSLITFWGYALEYRNLAYPVNVLYQNGIRWEDVVDENKVQEKDSVSQEWIVTVPGKGIFNQAQYITQSGDDRFILLNFTFFNLVDEAPVRKPTYIPPQGAQTLYEGLHFLSFRSSLFEGANIIQRKEADERKFKIAIYKVH